MNYREQNYKTMNDTEELYQKIDFLKSCIKNSIENEFIVYQLDKIETSGDKNPDMRVIVSTKRTFEAAEKYKGKKICCLDFANNHNIGGAPWSAGAQEESMCRISTLYPCLKSKETEFYKNHQEEFRDGIIDEMGNDDLIYIPNVTVFKTDEWQPQLRNEAEWFKTDVIVSAAPQLGHGFDKVRYTTIMTNRIKRILDVVARENVEVLILGAFGCGAFQNPPEIVAGIFNSLIRNYNFDIVEFAVFCANDNTNYEVFRNIISYNRKNPIGKLVGKSVIVRESFTIGMLTHYAAPCTGSASIEIPVGIVLSDLHMMRADAYYCDCDN